MVSQKMSDVRRTTAAAMAEGKCVGCASAGMTNCDSSSLMRWITSSSDACVGGGGRRTVAGSVVDCLGKSLCGPWM